MGEQVSAECRRQGAWGFLGEGVGAELLCPDTGAVLTKNHFFGKLVHLIIFQNISLKLEKYFHLLLKKSMSNYCTIYVFYCILKCLNN